MKRLAWLGLGAVIGAAAVLAYFGSRGGDSPMRRKADSLAVINKRLDSTNAALTASAAALLAGRDSIQRQRDSLKAASRLSTNKIIADRAKLPAADAVADSNFREHYAAGLKQLDSAIAELGRKDEIIRRDSLAQARSDSILSIKDGVIINLREQYANEQKASAGWKLEYERERGKVKCGKKCGIVIGIVSTVLAAVAVKQVQSALDP